MPEDSIISDLDGVALAPKPTQISTAENKKRKQSDGSCLSTGQTKDHLKEGKSRRQKKLDGTAWLRGTEDQEKKATKQTSEDEPPPGYIHSRLQAKQGVDDDKRHHYKDTRNFSCHVFSHVALRRYCRLCMQCRICT